MKIRIIEVKDRGKIVYVMEIKNNFFSKWKYFERYETLQPAIDELERSQSMRNKKIIRVVKI